MDPNEENQPGGIAAGSRPGQSTIEKGPR
jgi:hypothetical protein